MMFTDVLEERNRFYVQDEDRDTTFLWNVSKHSQNYMSHTQEDSNLYSDRRDNFKYHINFAYLRFHVVKFQSALDLSFLELSPIICHSLFLLSI